MPAYIKKLKSIKPDNPRLCNDDLLPAKQNWNWYNIFAFWMSDVHSVGGYIFAGTLFALGLTSWQILITLVAGISIVMVLANLLAKPSQSAGVPYPVIARMSFGVYGANIPALLRGIIAIVWYGIQTYLASVALTIILLKFFPHLAAWQEPLFLNLSYLGWFSFFIMWTAQTALFLMKMEAIRVFLDYSGPAVYIVMFLLMLWIVYKAGWENISFSLSSEKLDFWRTIGAMLVGMSLIVNYFAGPTLNFGDFSRYCRSMKDVRTGNIWGLPVNFTAFALTVIITITGTPVIFGQMIIDPLGIVAKMDNIGIVLLLAFTFVTATVGTNIVANFVSAANDISNLYPGRISWRIGGMIAAVLSVIITPWNLYNSPEVIHYTIDLLAGTLGPMYGIILVDYYLLRKRVIQVDDLFDDSPKGIYWYQNGYNRAAVKSMIPASCLSIGIVLLADFGQGNPIMRAIGSLAPFSLVISAIVGGILYYHLSIRNISE
ncbi:NCS1 family nucleobase:cation symporter-1 [Neisseria dentiae]|uniref:NCS1 family nucleobase:cation symporter-1 n=1 Tax=Neisseria dentiae TaxID=194197 RepID=UPI00211B84E0|nr:NCS1 family nucleobase:cation symporter-1 [Neisseria dentiae]MCQ9325984.1 NCS1 family nucleobase:cation symporter-1 [Neisseria dentiae]